MTNTKVMPVFFWIFFSSCCMSLRSLRSSAPSGSSSSRTFGLADERAGYGDALLLTAGKTGDAAVLKAGERDHAEHLVDALL